MNAPASMDIDAERTSMIAAAEVWVPLEDGTGLSLLESAYNGHEGLRACASETTLHAGAGLAGQVWSRELPLITEDFSDEGEARAAALRDAQVAAAVGVPVFNHGGVASVLVLYISGQPDQVGAVELWAGKRGRFELGLAGAHYAGLNRFGVVSRYVNFPMGSGLPGVVWQEAAPLIVEKLGQSQGFLRSTGAESEGLGTGFGLPVVSRTDLKSVLLLLSSETTPIARVHEVWRPKMVGGGVRMERTTGAYDGLDGVAKHRRSLSVHPGEGFAGRALAERRPVLIEAAEGRDLLNVGPDSGLRVGVAIPVLVADEVRSIAVLMW